MSAHATLRVPLRDHQASISLQSGLRPIRLDIDDSVFWLTREGAAAFADKLDMVVSLSAEDQSER